MENLSIRLERRDPTRSAKVERFAILLAGIVFILNANMIEESYTNSSTELFSYFIILIAAGLLNIVYALFISNKFFKKHKINFDKLMFGLSGIIFIIDGIVKFTLGYHLVKYFLLGVGIVYLIVAFKFEKFKGLRRLRIDQTGFSYRKVMFLKKHIKWERINSILFDTASMILINKKNKKIKFYFGGDEQAIRNFTVTLREIVKQKDISAN